MKRIKILLLMVLSIFIISLSSCDVSFLNDKQTLVRGSESEIVESISEEESTESSESKESKTSEAQETTESKESSKESKASSTESKTSVQSSESKESSKESSSIIESSANSSEESLSEEVLTGIGALLLDYNNSYSYQKLGEDTSYGEVMQEAYRTFYNASKELLLSGDNLNPRPFNRNGETVYYNIVGEYETTQANLSAIFSTIAVFVQDNPLFYFLETGYSTYSITSNFTTKYYACILCYDDYLLGSTREVINNEILNMVSETDVVINDLVINNEYQRIKAIHNFIINRINYSYATVDGVTVPNPAAYAHNIVGVVESLGAVCEGYSKCYKLLSDLYNINTIVVTGIAQTSTSSGGHAWNYSKVGEKWYGVDVTWDDQKMKMYQDDYLLVSKSTMDEEHFPYDQTYGLNYNVVLPTLSSTSYKSII